MTFIFQICAGTLCLELTPQAEHKNKDGTLAQSFTSKLVSRLATFLYISNSERKALSEPGRFHALYCMALQAWLGNSGHM